MHKPTSHTVGADIIRPVFPGYEKKREERREKREERREKRKGVGRADGLKLLRADDICPYEFYRTFSSNTVVLQQAENACFFIFLKKMSQSGFLGTHIGKSNEKGETDMWD